MKDIASKYESLPNNLYFVLFIIKLHALTTNSNSFYKREKSRIVAWNKISNASLGETHLCSSTFLNTIAGLLLMAFMKMNVSKKKFPKIFQEDYYYCWANKWTGFYMIGISAMKELNIPLLFYLRSGRLEVFFRNFAKFTGTHLCQSLLLNKVALFLMKHLQWLLLK